MSIKCATLLFAALLQTCAADDDYYQILGVSRMVDSEGVKIQYKKLAKKWHPDRNEDKDEANLMMKLINEAKDTLSDPTKREQYDVMLQRMSSVSAVAHIQLPWVLVVYFTCPVYVSFYLNSFIASFLCTSMLLSHVPVLIGCYLFYKYAMWGPVPKEDRARIAMYSNCTSLLMLGTLLCMSAVLMISITEYLPWFLMWVVTPGIAIYAVDITLCVQVKRERKFTGPAGSPRMVETTIHERPDYLPFYLSFQDLSEFVHDKIESFDYDPVVLYEYTRTQEIETRVRKCDLEEEEQKAEKGKRDAKGRKEAAAQKRLEEEEERKRNAFDYQDMSPKSSPKNSPKAAAKEEKKAPKAAPKKAEKKPDTQKASKEKKGEVANVTSTGSPSWSLDQQAAFEKALKKAPSGMANRWDAVSESVEGKTARQCAERFKELASLRTQLGTRKS